jgi:hypothetical protein
MDLPEACGSLTASSELNIYIRVEIKPLRTSHHHTLLLRHVTLKSEDTGSLWEVGVSLAVNFSASFVASVYLDISWAWNTAARCALCVSSAWK